MRTGAPDSIHVRNRWRISRSLQTVGAWRQNDDKDSWNHCKYPSKRLLLVAPIHHWMDLRTRRSSEARARPRSTAKRLPRIAHLRAGERWGSREARNHGDSTAAAIRANRCTLAVPLPLCVAARSALARSETRVSAPTASLDLNETGNKLLHRHRFQLRPIRKHRLDRFRLLR